MINDYTLWKHTFTVDASYNKNEEKIGIGIVIQQTQQKGRRGPIIEERSETFTPTDVSPGQMKLFAIFRAFQLGIDRGYTHILIRSDYNWIKKRIMNILKTAIPTEPNSLLGQVITLARSVEYGRVTYCPRRKNQIAHRLARKGAGILPKMKQDDDSEFDFWSW